MLFTNAVTYKINLLIKPVTRKILIIGDSQGCDFLNGINKNQTVIVIGRKFFGKIAMKNYFPMQDRELRVLRNEVGFESQEINNILKAKVAKNAILIDPHQLVCGNTQNCPVFTEQLRLISYDGRHLTKAGARYMGKILFENTMLGNI